MWNTISVHLSSTWSCIFQEPNTIHRKRIQEIKIPLGDQQAIIIKRKKARLQSIEMLCFWTSSHTNFYILSAILRHTTLHFPLNMVPLHTQFLPAHEQVVASSLPSLHLLLTFIVFSSNTHFCDKFLNFNRTRLCFLDLYSKCHDIISV